MIQAPHPSRPEPVRNRRRGVALEEAILQAAIEDIQAHGFAGMTMERIAQLAGTNKNTLYRRWPNRTALGLAAYQRMVSAEPAVPDTGSLREDVLAMLRQANHLLSSPEGAALREIMASVASDPSLSQQVYNLTQKSLTAAWLNILERAVQRGEAHPDCLHPRVATVAIVLLRNEYVLKGTKQVVEQLLEEITDRVYLPLVTATRESGTNPY